MKILRSDEIGSLEMPDIYYERKKAKDEIKRLGYYLDSLDYEIDLESKNKRVIRTDKVTPGPRDKFLSDTKDMYKSPAQRDLDS